MLFKGLSSTRTRRFVICVALSLRRSLCWWLLSLTLFAGLFAFSIFSVRHSLLFSVRHCLSLSVTVCHCLSLSVILCRSEIFVQSRQSLAIDRPHPLCSLFDPDVPCVAIPPCDRDYPAHVNISQLSSGKAPFPAVTSLSLCYTDLALEIQFANFDEKLWLNNHTVCDGLTYLQEVVEAFMAPAPTGDDPQFYTETELTPFNALYGTPRPFAHCTPLSYSVTPPPSSSFSSAAQLLVQNPQPVLERLGPWPRLAAVQLHGRRDVNDVGPVP